MCIIVIMLMRGVLWMQFVSFRFILFVSPPSVWESERMADDLENRLNESPKLLCCFTTRERERNENRQFRCCIFNVVKYYRVN
jgi:hypothetical protein